MKKLSILFAALILAGVISGCSQNAGGSTPEGEATPAAPSAGVPGEGESKTGAGPSGVTASED